MRVFFCWCIGTFPVLTREFAYGISCLKEQTVTSWPIDPLGQPCSPDRDPPKGNRHAGTKEQQTGEPPAQSSCNCDFSFAKWHRVSASPSTAYCKYCEVSVQSISTDIFSAFTFGFTSKWSGWITPLNLRVIFSFYWTVLFRRLHIFSLWNQTLFKCTELHFKFY